MKILIMTNYANGLYLFRKELLERLCSDGHELFVSVPFDEQCKKIEEIGCTVIHTDLERRGSNPIKDACLLKRYLHLLKVHKPDVVLTYTIKPNIYGGVSCRIRKIPYVSNVTGLGSSIENKGFLSKLILKMYRFGVEKAECVFFQNERNLLFMNEQKIAKKNGRLVPGSGVNLITHPYEKYPSEKSGIVFLAVMRIMKDKGIEEYLAVAKEISKKYSEVSFWLVGEYEAESQEYYEPIISRLQEQKVIKYFGHIDNVEEVMTKSHVIVHPSYHEGLSNVLLEAAACGRPVLASNVPGCQETVNPGKSGLLFEAKDAEALKEAIEKILSLSEQDREVMGIAGREWVENNFDRNIVIDAYCDILKRVENKNKGEYHGTV